MVSVIKNKFEKKKQKEDKEITPQLSEVFGFR